MDCRQLSVPPLLLYLYLVTDRMQGQDQSLARLVSASLLLPPLLLLLPLPARLLHPCTTVGLWALSLCPCQQRLLQLFGYIGAACCQSFVCPPARRLLFCHSVIGGLPVHAPVHPICCIQLTRPPPSVYPCLLARTRACPPACLVCLQASRAALPSSHTRTSAARCWQSTT